MSRADNPNRFAISGVLVIDKPLGRTSMQAVADIRRRSGGVKTGHAGTLDPLATGVLVLALGKATRIIDRIMQTSKRYRTVINLSGFAPTDDRESDPIAVHIDTPPTVEMLHNALTDFRGEIEQQPPVFSAVMVGGTRSYELARRGKAVELAPRKIHIHELELVRYDWPMVELDIHCGKGLYVRRLARDLGERLGTGGFCEAIRRTAVGPFTIGEAVAIDGASESFPADRVISIEDALARIDADV